MADENQDNSAEPQTRRVGPGIPSLQAQIQERREQMTPEERDAERARFAEIERQRLEEAERERLALREQHKETISDIAQSFGVKEDDVYITGAGSRIVVQPSGNEFNLREAEEKLSKAFPDKEIDYTGGIKPEIMFRISELEAENNQFLNDLKQQTPAILAEDPQAQYKPALKELKEAGFPGARLVFDSVSIPYPNSVNVEEREAYITQLNNEGIPVVESRSGTMTMNRDALLRYPDLGEKIEQFKDGIDPNLPTITLDKQMDKAAEELSKITGMKVERIKVDGTATGAFVVRDAGNDNLATMPDGKKTQVTNMIDEVLTDARDKAGIDKSTLGFAEGNHPSLQSMGINLTGNDLYITADPKKILAATEKLKAEAPEIKSGIAEITGKEPAQPTQAPAVTDPAKALAEATGMGVKSDHYKMYLDVPKGMDEQAALERLNKAAQQVGLGANTFEFTRSMEGDIEVMSKVVNEKPELLDKIKQEFGKQTQQQHDITHGSAGEDKIVAQSPAVDPRADIFAGRSDADRERMAIESAELDEARRTTDFASEKARIGITDEPQQKKAQVIDGVVQAAPPIAASGIVGTQALGDAAAQPGSPAPAIPVTRPPEPVQQQAEAAAPPIPAPRPTAAEREETVEEIKDAQKLLAAAGKNINPRGTFKDDGVDGIKGDVTTALIKEAQKEAGLPETGLLTDETKAALQAQADKAQGRAQQQGAGTDLPPVQPLEEAPGKTAAQPAPAEPAQVAEAKPKRNHEEPDRIPGEYRDPPGLPKEEKKPFVPLHLQEPKEEKPFLDPQREQRRMIGEAAPKQENVAAWLESMKAKYDTQAVAAPAPELSHRQAEDRTMEQYLKDAKSIGEGMTTKPLGAAIDMAANDDVPALAAGGKQRSAAAGMSA